MDRKSKQAIIGSCVSIVIVLAIVLIVLIKVFTPSKEVMPLTEYYPLGEDEVYVLLNGDEYEQKGLLIDGSVYMDYTTVKEQFNYRFYWDNAANLLIYTTPTEIIKAEVNQAEFTVVKSIVESKEKYDKTIVKVFGDKVYVSLDFVQKYSNLQYKYYTEPNRIVMETSFEEHLVTTVQKSTQLRVDANIKSDILVQLPQGTHLTLVDINEEAPRKGFIKVMTDDGVVGYVKSKYTNDTYYEAKQSTYVEPNYTSIQKSYKINLVWHQVFNTEAYKNLEGLLKSTKGVTTISPTWFKVADEEGNLNSLASKDYVEKANALGVEVWALVSDLDIDVNMYKVLSNTKNRENLENKLIEYAQEYKLNGINIDFEKITNESATHYIEFLRELSVKCRNNGIVLSVDNYVPAAYNMFYDREEQGKIVDYVIVMAYDEHYAGGEEAGSTSSLPFVKDAVKNTLEEVPAEKTVIALPFYTRLWKTDKDGNLSSEAYGMSGAMQVLKDAGVEAQWDAELAQYYGSYENGEITYQIWLEEDTSFEEKLKAVCEYDVAGIAAWKLGLEKESVWNVINRYLY